MLWASGWLPTPTSFIVMIWKMKLDHLMLVHDKGTIQHDDQLWARNSAMHDSIQPTCCYKLLQCQQSNKRLFHQFITDFSNRIHSPDSNYKICTYKINTNSCDRAISFHLDFLAVASKQYLFTWFSWPGDTLHCYGLECSHDRGRVLDSCLCLSQHWTVSTEIVTQSQVAQVWSTILTFRYCVIVSYCCIQKIFLFVEWFWLMVWDGCVIII